MTLLEKEILHYMNEHLDKESFSKMEAIQILFEGFRIGVNFGYVAAGEDVSRVGDDFVLGFCFSLLEKNREELT
jgi:hypothetical protein